MGIEDFLTYAALPCPGGCNICPFGGEMTNRDAEVTMSTGDVYFCYQLNLAGMLGYLTDIPGDLCNALPAIVDEPCGCEGGVETEPTTAAPLVAPTVTAEETTKAPVPVPDTDTAVVTTDAPTSSAPSPVPELVEPEPVVPESGVTSSSNYVLVAAAVAVTTFR